MWFKWFKNYPKRYKVMALGGAYAFAALGAVAGVVWWIRSGCKNVEALILTAAGVGVFFLFRMLSKNTIVPENEERQEKIQ